MSVDKLVEQVTKLVDTTVKGFTHLADWIAEGDTDDMTPEEIAEEWNELSE
jgi:hypothetical protein